MTLSAFQILENIKNSDGYSRSNQFSVEIILPARVRSKISNSSLSRVEFNCTTSSLPGRAFEVLETSYSGGYSRKKAGNTAFSDLELEFYLSGDLLEKRVFDAWQSFILDPSYQVSTYPKDYYGEIIVTKESNVDGKSPIGSYHFMDAFPINVQDVSQSYDSASTVDKLPVTFSYHRWFFSST